LTARGLTTSPMPYQGRSVEVLFDFVDHNLYVQTSEGQRKAMPLLPRSVADFYREFLSLLKALQLDVHLWPMPVEIPDPVPFDQDTEHASYDPAQVNRFFQVLSQVDRVQKEFSGRFYGKQSPAHFF